jgi:dCMP deaminase
MTPPRTSKDMYYLGIAKEVSKRSTCFRRAIGAIIVRDDQIISTGYVGAPRKTKDSL